MKGKKVAKKSLIESLKKLIETAGVGAIIAKRLATLGLASIDDMSEEQINQAASYCKDVIAGSKKGDKHAV